MYSCEEVSTAIKGGDENVIIEYKVAKSDDDRYSLKVPNFMKKANALHPEASIQYQNLYKEVYLIGLDEDKYDIVETFEDLGEWDEELTNIQNYRKIYMNFFSENSGLLGTPEIRPVKIRGMDAEIVTLEVKVEDIPYDLFYSMGFIEGEEKFYMLMAWTLLDNKKKYNEPFEKMIRSFKINQSAESVPESEPETEAEAEEI